MFSSPAIPPCRFKTHSNQSVRGPSFNRSHAQPQAGNRQLSNNLMLIQIMVLYFQLLPIYRRVKTEDILLISKAERAHVGYTSFAHLQHAHTCPVDHRFQDFWVGDLSFVSSHPLFCSCIAVAFLIFEAATARAGLVPARVEDNTRYPVRGSVFHDVRRRPALP